MNDEELSEVDECLIEGVQPQIKTPCFIRIVMLYYWLLSESV